MARYSGDIVVYVTNAGEVPAVVLAYYNTDLTTPVDADANGTVTHADLLTLGYQGTRLSGVPRADEGTAGVVTFASKGTVDPGEWYVPGAMVSS